MQRQNMRRLGSGRQPSGRGKELLLEAFHDFTVQRRIRGVVLFVTQRFRRFGKQQR
ncbi:hypothetical protein D3C75_849200 [compost metagenome]